MNMMFQRFKKLLLKRLGTIISVVVVIMIVGLLFIVPAVLESFKDPQIIDNYRGELDIVSNSGLQNDISRIFLLEDSTSNGEWLNEHLLFYWKSKDHKEHIGYVPYEQVVVQESNTNSMTVNFNLKEMSAMDLFFGAEDRSIIESCNTYEIIRRFSKKITISLPKKQLEQFREMEPKG